MEDKRGEVTVHIAQELKKYSEDISVLYVEDDVDLRENTMKLLSRFFCAIENAPNGAEGLRRYSAGSFDIVITDIRMPEMDGVEMARRIREINPDQGIIVTSAHSEVQYLLELINIGINRFVVKPLDVERFLYALTQACKKIQNDRVIADFYRKLKQMADEETEKRRRSEQLLIQQSKLASMGEMLGAISHQWMQPLNAIALIVQDIKEVYDHDGFDEKYLGEAVISTMDCVKFMSTTVDSFRRFLKPSKDKTRFDVKEAIEDIVQMFSGVFKSHGIAVSLEAKEVNFYVHGYPNEFKQVILNIINNSKDAIESRGTNDSDFDGKITITIVNEGKKTAIYIVDNGGGIPAEIIEKIFDPYFTTKTETKGTGIGLYMSKTITENNMNGKLTVKNIEDGAEFKIEIQSCA
ncbi:MAG: hybrid sensor histidine kinase/response regulator [Nitrospirae bacterium]|nr:hybrid sensor histidine kinase/response regulator [Nitrospirota bacterium]